MSNLQDITLETGAGLALYEVAKKKEVFTFLEVGTQGGGSAACIGKGLLETSGSLDTIEAIESRVSVAEENLKGLPVTVHWMSTINHEGLKRYYSHSQEQIKEADGSFERLVLSKEYDAVFLDSCRESQMYELDFIVKVSKPKHLLMHEPDEKCPNYDNLLKSKGYELKDSGRDRIGNNNPLWVHYEYTL